MQNGSLNDAAAVKEQYATSKDLDIRITFHEMYSTNKQGFGNWIVSHYAICDGMHVLELGCGTASMWQGHEDLIERCGKLILTDLSDGMLKTAKGNLGEYANVEYREADIQDLPFKENTFDVVIANMMLYHVPDIYRGLSEVRRVLKEGGTFYCATLGEKNFTDKLGEWFALSGEDFHPNHNFTIQNGKEKLKSTFSDVTALLYEDSLHITNPDDLVEYIRSLSTFAAVTDLPAKDMHAILEKHTAGGCIDLPKNYGMFVCR